jgi:hypothetical protein
MDAVAAIAVIVDVAWYARRYGDVTQADALRHFVAHGLAEGRDPNPFFDSAWYHQEYPETAGTLPLLHYLQTGAAELRDPHPRFDAAWYARQHPEGSGNPLLHHLKADVASPTEPEPDFSGFRPDATPTGLTLTIADDIAPPGLSLQPTSRGMVLSLPGRTPLRLPPERMDDLVRLLRDLSVSRLTILDFPVDRFDLRALVDKLGVAFDLVLRDYLAICPQRNLRPWPDAAYCGEPGPAGCNACIAARPSFGATDILTWRHRHAWMFRDADRVICPSRDALTRLQRYGLAERAVVEPSGAALPKPRRRAVRTLVVVVPERFGNGTPSPCGYIRLLQPLDHLAAAGAIDMVVTDAAGALRHRPDVVVTQRYAMPDRASADKLARHCRTHGIKLIYDLDDDLLNIPRNHPEAAILRPQAKLVARMLGHADAVWVSTEALQQTIGAKATVVPNGLDERIWAAPPMQARRSWGPLRILYMGTTTHEADFAMVEPALIRLHKEFAGRVGIDLIGVTARGDLPTGINRIAPPSHALASYPGFVDWIMRQSWDLGIAPLADTGFNRAKSAIKTLDYAALGLAVLASDVRAYRGSCAELIGNNDWFMALERLVRDPQRRLAQAQAAQQNFLLTGTLSAQAKIRRAALGLEISPSRRVRGPA